MTLRGMRGKLFQKDLGACPIVVDGLVAPRAYTRGYRCYAPLGHSPLGNSPNHLQALFR